MTSSLNSAFSHVIDEKRYLGIDETSAPIADRFAFFVAKKRGADGRFYETVNPSGKKIPAYFYYMHDRATDDLYGLHTKEQLPKYFLLAGLGTVPVTVITVAWSLAMVVVTAVNAVFEVFQDVYPTRDVDVAKGFLTRLQVKGTEKFDEIKSRLQWVKSSVAFGVAIEAAVINALLNWKDEKTLLEMKVVIARIEHLWNRKVDFRVSSQSQLNRFNKEMEDRLKAEPQASRGAVALELIQNFDWKNFTSVSYTMQCFQSRGKINDTEQAIEEIRTSSDELGFTEERHYREVKLPKFEIIPGTEKMSYQSFAEFMDRWNPSWRKNL